MMVLVRNSARDGRKGDKLSKRWLGPYSVNANLGKGVFQIANIKTGKVLKKAINSSRHAQYLFIPHYVNFIITLYICFNALG